MVETGLKGKWSKSGASVSTDHSSYMGAGTDDKHPAWTLKALVPRLTAKSAGTLCYQGVTLSAQLTLQPHTEAQARRAKGRDLGVITMFLLTAVTPAPAKEAQHPRRVPSSPVGPHRSICSSCDRHQKQTPKRVRKS